MTVLGLGMCRDTMGQALMVDVMVDIGLGLVTLNQAHKADQTLKQNNKLTLIEANLGFGTIVTGNSWLLPIVCHQADSISSP